MTSESCTCRKAGGTPADILRDTLLVAALYWAVSHITKTFFSSFGVLPMPIWPAASVAVAAAIIRGWRVAAGIAIGSVLANAVSLGSSWPVACGIAAMNTAGPLLCAGMIRRHASSMPPFSRTKDSLLFLFFGVIVMAALTATGGSISIFAGGRITIAQAPAAWLRWWIAHAGGALLFTPLLLCWWENHRPQPSPY